MLNTYIVALTMGQSKLQSRQTSNQLVVWTQAARQLIARATEPLEKCQPFTILYNFTSFVQQKPQRPQVSQNLYFIWVKSNMPKPEIMALYKAKVK